MRGTVRRMAVAATAVLVTLGSTCVEAQQSWPLWNTYCDRFLDAQGRVIDRGAHDRTTSEGQAYAMFFALIANDRRRFEKLLSWTTINLAHGNLSLHLPAWLWGRSPAGQWKTLDENSASDADLWIAYTLLQAGRLWHEPRYTGLGRSLADRIEHEEMKSVAGLGMTVLPSAHGFQIDAQHFILNPSYIPPQVISGLMRERPRGPWSGVLASLPTLFSEQAGHGFAMDWVKAGPEGITAAATPVSTVAETPVAKPWGSYDAVRVYLWLGTADGRTPSVQDLLRLTGGMEKLLRDGAAPPLAVDPQGRVLQQEAPVGFSAAVVPYLEALALSSQARSQQGRIAAAQKAGLRPYGEATSYYDQNLVLFSTGWSEKRYRFEASGTLLVKWKQPRHY